jgi:hypothetical protein
MNNHVNAFRSQPFNAVLGTGRVFTATLFKTGVCCRNVTEILGTIFRKKQFQGDKNIHYMVYNPERTGSLKEKKEIKIC